MISGANNASFSSGNFPGFPNTPGIPNIPNIPGIPNIPNFPNFPEFPSFPGFPQQPPSQQTPFSSTDSFIYALREADTQKTDGLVTRAELTNYSKSMQQQIRNYQQSNTYGQFNSQINGMQKKLDASNLMLNRFTTFAPPDRNNTSVSEADVRFIANRDGNASDVSDQDLNTKTPAIASFNYTTNVVSSVVQRASQLDGTADGRASKNEISKFSLDANNSARDRQVAKALLNNFDVLSSGASFPTFNGFAPVQKAITTDDIQKTAALDGNISNFTTRDVILRAAQPQPGPIF